MTAVSVALPFVVVATLATLLVTQFTGWSHARAVVIVQALAHWVIALTIPVTVVAFITRQWVLGSAGAVVLAAGLGLSQPLLTRPRQRDAATGATPVRVFHSNLLYENKRPTEMIGTLEGVNADVLAFTEYTEAHAALLHDSSISEHYPHRIEHPTTRPGGSAIWSRHPLTEIDSLPSRYPSTTAVIGTAEPFTLYVVHPPSPFITLDGWRRELDELRALHVRRTGPAVVVGDFNADHWHPPFRRLLAAGWRDAHHLLRRPFSASWPTDRRPVPPFTRLDHALVNDELVVLDVRNVVVPGSDHIGLVVTVVVAR
jgi:endonuclease/exonuclease/phosphatase (EEP) superfamily protein YafD